MSSDEAYSDAADHSFLDRNMEAAGCEDRGTVLIRLKAHSADVQ